MYNFKDSVNITVVSGDGGPGCVSFLREKFNAKGGPDGGNGGNGGSVIFKVRENLCTLSFYKNGHVLCAENGKSGMGFKRSGANGKDLILFVPPNTGIYNGNDGTLLYKLKNLTDEFVILKGGRGGLGNWNFKTSVRRAPRFAQPGESGNSLDVRLELFLVADIGLVGLPNAGKSSLLNRITSAKSRVANYPFTTKIPHLGILRYSWDDLIIADIPGIIKGASFGVGLGTKFLKHIAKTKILALVIDISEANFLESYNILLNELKSYSYELFNKKKIIVANKLDLDNSDRNFDSLIKTLKKEKIVGISIYENRGIDELIKELFILAKTF
ncbi:GTPase ObgE [Borreliella yangtzensis]|uniref:GTPase Obg n=1 Tax=Borreliella yangtzensis TaxID=683292 RepID=A0ABR6PDJ0_9SPIR|nr:Obg family GTPase CgtA [Borreliella yangtzensis]MBB6042761.1 GTP-binding protein [Borreliella yangtzensis]WKC73718.1 Obg family GTPase CgtA [Borreliella yangtzensis]WKC74634.1 Obg family GTPase CgtA [Borreliella yangtzensis]